METDTETTEVIFRKFKQGGEIIALFPYEICDNHGNCESYMIVGQHSAANYQLVIQNSWPVHDPFDYSDIKAELMGLGYRLKVQQKRNHSKWLKNYYKTQKEWKNQ